MKYGIITHYDVHNHGAFLQLNGLCKVLKRDFNIDAQALRFDKNFEFAEAGVKEKHKISIKSIGYFINYIKERGIGIFLFNIRKKILFSRFNKKEHLIGVRCDQSEKLDGVIIGSDEVFALHTGPTPEFLGYNLPSDNVFAYAGCFGPTTIDDVKKLNCEEFVRNGLFSMKGLSMRDQNSISIAKKLTGRDSVLVVDPVILYGYHKELVDLEKPKLPKYILVYAYESRMNNPDEYQPILDYAHKNGMITVCPGFYHSWADKNHGCVLSLITGCDMAVKLRDNANKLYNLMQEYKIDDRVIREDWNLDRIFCQKVDWSVVNEQIDERRSISMAYLKEMIEK